MIEERVEGAVTVLFTDVEGSTDMRTRLGDEAADELLRTHEEIVRERVAKNSGREIKALGDGFMVAFTSPRRAISCAVEIQRALDDRNRNDPGRELRVRIGINAGEVTEKAGDLFGAAVNAAARIAGKARGGQILVANVVKDLAGMRPDLSYVDRGLFWLKGFPERWRLFEVLRQAAGPAQELATPVMRKTEFVGRDAERADLRRHVENAATGRGALVMIGGEPGVGKTRITEELAEEAATMRLMTMVGHCAETEAAPPYAPVAEMFEATLRTISRESVRAALGDAAPEIARIMPEVRRLFPDLPAPIELPPEQERRYLFNSITDFLSRASHMQPLLLILEDLHWADEPSLLLLNHLAERLSDLPILMVGTYRDVELDVDRPLARTLEELVRRRLVHRIALSRLPKEGVTAMLQGLAGREPPPSLVEAVYAETEGNCFFVEEVFQHLFEEGKLFDAQGDWRTEVRIGEVDVPEGVRLVLGRRLARLSEGARRALAGAAVIGRSFTFELVEALGEVASDALLDGIEEAHRARLVSSAEDAYQSKFTFAHELIRQTLLTGLSLPRRQRLHLRVAEAIERVHARDLDARASDLAHHLYQAGAAADPEKTVHYLVLSGDRAMEGAAFEDALRSYERAASLQPEENARPRAELLFKLGFAQRSLGRTEESLASWRSALDIYAGLDDRDATARACWDISYQLGWAGRAAEGMEFVQRGLLALGDARTAERGYLLASAGTFVGYLGDREGGVSMNDEALAIAQELGDRRVEGYAGLSRCVVHYAYCEHGAIVEEGPRVAQLLRETSSPFDLSSLLCLLEWSFFVTGRTAESETVHAELEPLARRIGNQVAWMLTMRANATRHLSATLDLDAWERFVNADLEFCRNADLEWISNSYGFLYRLKFLRGEWEEALAHAREALETEPVGGFQGWSWSIVFTTLAHLGRREEALAMLEQARGRMPESGRHATWGSWSILHGAVEGLCLLGEHDEAAALYPKVLETRRTGSLLARAYDVRLTETIAGLAALSGKKWDEAEGHFREAIRQAEAAPVVLETADARRFYATMLAERDAPGDRDHARELLDEALDVYRGAGMSRHTEIAETQLKEL